MSPKQYCRALNKLGFTRYSAAAFLGVSRPTSYNYASGVSEVPKAIEMLLRVMITNELAPEYVESLLGP